MRRRVARLHGDVWLPIRPQGRASSSGRWIMTRLCASPMGRYCRTPTELDGRIPARPSRLRLYVLAVARQMRTARSSSSVTSSQPASSAAVGESSVGLDRELAGHRRRPQLDAGFAPLPRHWTEVTCRQAPVGSLSTARAYQRMIGRSCTGRADRPGWRRSAWPTRPPHGNSAVECPIRPPHGRQPEPSAIARAAG